MNEEIIRFAKIEASLRKMSGKVKLIKLLTEAKQEYESYELNSAQKTLKEAFELYPNNPVVLRGLGCIEQSLQHYDKAIYFYNQALNFSEAKEIEYTLIGTALYLQDRLEEAINYFNLAIDTNDNYDRAYEGRNQAVLENHVKILEIQDILKKYFYDNTTI